MSTGAWAPACLLLTALAGASPGAIPADVYPMKETRFEIPIKVDPSRRSEIRVIELYISTDQGKTWLQRGSVPPDTPSFPFLAQADGTYWFSIVVIDRNNVREPPDPYTAPVGMKVLIDTLKPDVRLKTDRQDDTVTVRWNVKEEYPDLSRFSLEWKPTEGAGKWNALTVPPSLNGQATIRASEAITVRAKLLDAAGNVGEVETKVPGSSGVVTVSATGPATTPMTAADSAALPPMTPSAKPPEVTGVISLPSTGKPTPPAPPSGPEDLGGLPSGLPTPLPSSTWVAPAPAPVAAVPEPKSVSVMGTNIVASAPPTPPPPPVKETLVVPAPSATLPTPVPVPTLSSASPPAASPTTPDAAGTAARELPVINTRKVTMEYEVVKYGPSGVGGVDLYVTRDDGLTWKKMQGEHQSAGGTETSPGLLKRTVSVDLTEDGSYGFYLVVKSGAGLSQPAPRTGDTPHMRVKLDTRLPEAELYLPEQNPNQKEALLLKWKATDDNLTPSPISIQWAERPTGPWNHIGPERMANSGSFSWVVPERIPPQVFLRLTVRDTASNINMAETPQPVLIDLIRPVVGGVRFVGPR